MIFCSHYVPMEKLRESMPSALSKLVGNSQLDTSINESERRLAA